MSEQIKKGEKMSGVKQTIKEKNMEMEKIKSLEGEIKLIKDELIKVKSKTSKLSKGASDISKLCNGKYLLNAQQDAKDIHYLYGVVFLKTIVATEALMLARQIYKKKPEKIYFIAERIISAFDYAGDWWTSKQNYTLHQWVNVFEKISI